MTITINVSNESALRNAIFQVSNDFATDGAVADDYVINITGPITLTQSLPMIRGDGIHTITFNGNGNTIDADNAGRVFFVESGLVTISDVTIANAMAQGGRGGNDPTSNGGGGGGGGGLGAGAAVFVNSGAVVTLSGVEIADAAAQGGHGGNGGFGAPSNPYLADSGGGGGGLGGDGGSAGGGGGGGGGYEGAGGHGELPGNEDGSGGSGGGGGEFGQSGNGFRAGGGGGGQQGAGGSADPDNSNDNGGGGGGATTNGGDGTSTSGGAGGAPEGGDGGAAAANGDPAAAPLGGGGGAGIFGDGGDGLASGGGGGGADSDNNGSGSGGLGGGGGGSPQRGGAGGDFGGGGGGGDAAGGAGGFGGGGGGSSILANGGEGGFGGGGGGGWLGHAGGTFGGTGGTAANAVSPGSADGGGGAALGGAIFVRDGGTLIIANDTAFTGTYAVTGGTTGGAGGATGGQAQGKVFFLHGSGNATLAVAGGNTRTFAAADSIAGDGTFTKSGDGTLVLGGDNGNFLGNAVVAAGLLQVDGSIANATTTTVQAGGTLGGNGTVGTTFIDAGGTLAPGASAGQLTTGLLLIQASATFAVELGGTTAGASYDQVIVTGTAGSTAIAGATLDASLIDGFVPGVGDTFTIIANDQAHAVSGSFEGLAEGATFVVDSSIFSISYQGGDGNDVVLTAEGVVIIGTDGADVVDATNSVPGQPLPTEGNDQIMGQGGADTLSGLPGDDRIKGNKGADILRGNDGDDTLTGGKGKDQLKGGNDDDWLDGHEQNDKLTGGAGDDCFVFSTKLGSDNVDKVTDFGKGNDLIYLDDAVFTKLGAPGTLQSKHFTKGSKADGGKGQIVYEKSEGKIYYAKKGDDGGQVLFAKVDKGTALQADDFVVF